MEKNGELIEKLKREFLGQKVIVYPGPKTSFKVTVTILLFLSFTFGLIFLTPKPMPTGYMVSGASTKVTTRNWLGLPLVAIPIILALFWLKKYKSSKI